MITIDINGTTVEGETLKEAQRLARKEEKRQAKEHKEKEAKRDNAKKIAWAEVGRLACHEHARIWLYLPSKHPNLVRHEEGRSILRVVGENGESADWTSTGYSIDAVLIHMNDVVYGARFSSEYDGKALVDWVFFGLYQGEVLGTSAECLYPRLEKVYEESLASQYTKQAA